MTTASSVLLRRPAHGLILTFSFVHSIHLNSNDSGFLFSSSTSSRHGSRSREPELPVFACARVPSLLHGSVGWRKDLPQKVNECNRLFTSTITLIRVNSLIRVAEFRIEGFIAGINKKSDFGGYNCSGNLEDGMNLRLSRRPMLTILLGVVIVRSATVGAPALAQTRRVSAYDPLNAFVGTWAATRPGENVPFLLLKLQESDGKLTGTMSHFKIGVIGNGTVIGTPKIGESTLAKLTLGQGDLRFVWGEPPLDGDEARFVLEGTTKAQLVISVSAEHIQRVMSDSPGASGFDPVIYMARAAETDDEKQTRSPVEKWEVGMMARLINTAEAQYKFAKGRYADYATLLSSGQLKDTGGREFTLLPGNWRSESDPLPGYRLRLLMSSDGGSYELSIRDETADCATALFSDETGVIFEGPARDCPSK